MNSQFPRATRGVLSLVVDNVKPDSKSGRSMFSTSALPHGWFDHEVGYVSDWAGSPDREQEPRS